MEAVKRTKDGAVCLISALAFYNLTEEIPRQHWIAIRHDTMHVHPPSTKVVRLRNFGLGKTTAKIRSVTFPIFDRKRTVVDSFRFLSTETAIKSLKAAIAKNVKEKINRNLVQTYAKKLRVNIEPYLLAITT
jgi:predicted transcriptional regulator of viral defense system